MWFILETSSLPQLLIFVASCFVLVAFLPCFIFRRLLSGTTCHNQNMPEKTPDLMEATSVRSLEGDFIREPLHTNPFEDVQALKQSNADENGNIQKQQKTLSGTESVSQGCITSSNRESVEASSCTEDSPKNRTEALTREVRQNCVIYSNNVSDVKSFSEPGYNDGVLMNQNLTVWNGQYRFNKEFLQDKMIGEGDYGIVIACHDWKTKGKIATKMKENLRPFEVSLLAEVKSMPFIIGFLGATTEGNILYLHMELFQGACHLEYFAQEGWKHLKSQVIVVQICLQLLQALDYLSRRQIIHRDLTGKYAAGH
ncbi:Mitogen-activated protein kinase kinase kinase 8 [Holothuria leucospilota]|uniref:Mitogen-activated protein kinase kinase kinase 8 n=1 Tax=Holothuria leucospilota TaxID=206669 RepID=A0A9Q1C759_HOLLE|nr:Mitogen-activated protein kinase kinase kinase 8 [Holothuria leucospilota]